VSEANILSGLHVIDCGTYVAAPAAAVVMSDFGADVIKIERPPYGDPYRYLSLVPGMPVSPLHYCWILEGRNKRSVALDLSDAGAREVLSKLVATADVFVTNYQQPLIRRFRIAYEDLAPLNGRLIYAYLSGYGLAGEEADQPGYDITAYWARSGMMSAMHYAGADPVPSAPRLGDHPTSMALFGGIMLGLYQRERTGHGMNVSTSLLANGAWANSCAIQGALAGATFLPKRTRATTVNPIVNHYVTRDQQRFFTCCLDPRQDWPNLCRALEHPEWLDDPRFVTPEHRRANSRVLVSLIDAAVAEKDMAEWKVIFRRHGVIWGPVPKTEDVPDDPQMQANGIFPEVEPGVRTVASPLDVAGVDKLKPRKAPEVGQHTIQVLESLGYNREAIFGLLNRRAAMDPSMPRIEQQQAGS